MPKTLPLCLTLLMLAVLPRTNAQSEQPSAAAYLAASGAEKQRLREGLLALSAAELRRAIAACSPVAPTESGVIERETMCPDGFKRPFWLYVPTAYDASKSYPLVVCLHGSCAQMPMRGRGGSPAPGQWALNTWKDNLPERWESEVALLGCAAGVPETNAEAVWYHRGGEANVLHMIAEAKRILSIDANRVFASGHSDGGNGSFGFAFRRPEAFAGYLPMNGNFTVPMLDETPIWWENLKGQHIYAFNGKADDLYPANELTPFYDLANALGADITYRVYDTLTHDISPVVADEVKASLEQRVATWKRDQKPADVDWTCTNPVRGRRAWLSIDAIRNLGAMNAVPENAPLTGARPRLGVQLTQADTPTVDKVVVGGAADAAGLKAGDVLLRLDDTAVATARELLDALAPKRIGEDFRLLVRRDGKELELKGRFPKALDDGAWHTTDKARVVARWKPGQLTIDVSNAAQLSIYVFAEMLGPDGSLAITVNAKPVPLVKVEPDNALMLDEFERTGDRDGPWLRCVKVNVEELLRR